MFFCFLLTLGFWSIITFLLFFRKKKTTYIKYILTRHMTWMTSKRCVYMKTCLCVFLKRRKDLFRSFKKSNIFKYISTCQTLSEHLIYKRCLHVCIFSLYTVHLLLLSRQASITMWTILISKSWWWLLKPKRLTLTLHHSKFTYLDYHAFLLSSFFIPFIYHYKDGLVWRRFNFVCWLFCFTAYQYFLGHLTRYWILKKSV